MNDQVEQTFTEQGALVGLRTRKGIYKFDSLYSALGCRVRSELPRLLGVACDDRGQIVVDEQLRTSVEDVYAAGDVANDLNQIAVAAGHAAIAATAIHNRLRSIEAACGPHAGSALAHNAPKCLTG